METSEQNPDKKKNEKRNILKEEGSSRAVLSGAYAFLFAIVGSITLWFFTVIATDNPGLAYFGMTGAIIGIFQVLGTGCGQSFLARVKTTLVDEGPEAAIIKASTYTKVLILIGVLMACIAFLLAILISDPLIRMALLMAIPPVLISYSFGSLGGMLNVDNRFDLTSFVGCFFGIIVFIVGGLLIWFNADPVLFTIIHLCITINSVLLMIIFFIKFSPFKLKELYSKGTLFSEESSDFIKDSSFSTLTNLESIGLLGNLIIFLTAFFLSLWYPSVQILAVQILTIVMTYAIVKAAIIFFASPLNIEIAEATAKDNRDIIQNTITDIGRIAFLIGLILLTIVCAGSGIILKTLHLKIFLNNSGEINKSLLISSQVLLIMCAIGQSCYGFAALFGNALIGSGYAKYSAIVFGITLIIAIILTPIFVFLFGFIGAGIAMLLTGLFVLPYMLIEVKRKMNIKLNFRVLNHIPYLTIVFLLIFFYPLERVLYHITTGQDLTAGLIGVVMLIGIVLAFIIGIPFCGVMGPGDGKLIRDITQSFNAEWLGNFAIKMGRFFYYLNPFHKRPST